MTIIFFGYGIWNSSGEPWSELESRYLSFISWLWKYIYICTWFRHLLQKASGIIMTGSIYFDRALKSHGRHKFKKIILASDRHFKTWVFRTLGNNRMEIEVKKCS